MIYRCAIKLLANHHYNFTEKSHSCQNIRDIVYLTYGIIHEIQENTSLKNSFENAKKIIFEFFLAI